MQFMVISTYHLTVFFFTATSPTEIYTLSLHDALPICDSVAEEDDEHVFLVDLFFVQFHRRHAPFLTAPNSRSEEHTSELQSRFDLVCRLLLEKKKKINNNKAG